ncbi:signal transduction histidine kinase [Runella defluvii]|uniref:histidine kinase n=1 Tax=Runella defluvii TaxID=370973 RepID=A0A7W6ETL8_9BACT|nr:ATP-binding protein [Runella defluvii]MBB3841995.1 signal transduction histidine kinase [Runella defluvii]
MQLLRILKLVSVGILCLCIGQSCTTKKTPTPALKSLTVVIDSNFTSESLNERVLVSTKISKKDLTRPDLKMWITQRTTKVSQKKDAIMVGDFRKYPEAWFYMQVINTSHTSQKLVVDEFSRIRCDDFEVFTSNNGIVQYWGKINRATRFASYPLPFLTYAVPVTIQPKDTLNLLIHTQRNYGNHEVNLSIASYQTYVDRHLYLFLSKIAQVIIFIICIITMFVLGRIFRFKIMTYLGYYLISLLFFIVSCWGFVDFVLKATSIGLSGNNAPTFGLFVACCLNHPFNMELMKPVPKNEKLFKGISYLLMGTNLFASCCFFLPKHIFPSVDAYFFLSKIVLFFVLIAIIWVLICSLMALVRAKIYYIGLGYSIALFAILPLQIVRLLDKSPSLIIIDLPVYTLFTIGFTLITIYMLREQLVSRKKMEESLQQERESMEEIRKTEVEVIGRNLHDNVGNILVSAMGYLHLNSPKIELSQELIKESINEIRFLSHNLVKDDDAPLHTKLESLVSRFNDFMEVRFVFEDYSKGKLNSLDSIMQQNIYMIVQEVFTNIVKHAKATEVFVQVFEREGQTLQVIVEDDGIGILNFTENKGIGLKNIQKRADISKLTLTVDSTPSGTMFIIETPKIA